MFGETKAKMMFETMTNVNLEIDSQIKVFMSKLKELAFEINDTEQELREKIHILKQKVEKLNLENKTLKEIGN